ncbi:MAG: type II toxin-antitoxin system RelE/ParE family toxin [Bacteroidales bacterium]|nr:type II toxin-antitoxin system RelE/ParE family toxin [Bacteroidales bacterium]
MKSHVIFYFQLSDGDILVVRILHEKMDFPSNILS